MEKSPGRSNADAARHQAELMAMFPEAADQLAYRQPLLPPGTLKLLFGRPEFLSQDARLQEKLKTKLIDLVPKRFETYLKDLTVLQKKNPEATLAGVSYDPLEEKLTAPGLYMEEEFLSQPLIMGSMGRAMTSRARIEYDCVATIQKRMIGIDKAGRPENLYIAEITRQNSKITGDVHRAWEGADGEALIRIAIDESDGAIFAEVGQGPVDRSTPLQSAIEVLEQAFPRSKK